MGQDDKPATESIQEPARATLEDLNIADFVKGLVLDLQELRAGKINVVEARARAKLAHEILRGINQIVNAQRFLNGAMKTLPSPETEPPATGRKPRRGKTTTIDG